MEFKSDEMFHNSSEVDNYDNSSYALPLIRQPVHLLVIYCVAYGIIFMVGLAGNAFVVIAISLNISMRNITNYLITNLAIADLLIIILNLPATLASNLFFEWWLGDVMCRLSVWTTGATVSASVYTLVAVSADRYCALCHTMRYSVVSKSRTFFVTIPIWIFSAALFSPWLAYFKQITFTDDNNLTSATICIPAFPSPESERLYFLIANILIAYFIPLIAVTVFYVYIYSSLVNRGTLAVDKHAQERESRTKMKITKMMLVVVILFAASWAPLYILYLDFYFFKYISEDLFTVCRPLFQWLALSNSCINPILYAYFSRRFRRAFQEILVMPCTKRYQEFKSYTANTSRRWMSTVRESRTFDFSGLTVPGGSKRPSAAFSIFGGSGKRPSAFSIFSKRPSAAPSLTTSAGVSGESGTVYTRVSGEPSDDACITSSRRRTSSGKTFGAGRRRSTGIRRRDLRPSESPALISGQESTTGGQGHIEETSMTEISSVANVRPLKRMTSAPADKIHDYCITVCDTSIVDSPALGRVLSQRRSDEERRATAAKLRNGLLSPH